MLYKGYEIKQGTLRTKYSEKTSDGGIFDPATGKLLALCENVRLAKAHIDDRVKRGVAIGMSNNMREDER